MSAAPRAERLRDRFVGWQCRVRADAMRRRDGQPAPGMRPGVLDSGGALLAPAVTTLLVRRKADSFARRVPSPGAPPPGSCATHDPRDRREAALTLLAERYYRHARDFSGQLTATFAVGSRLAARLVREGRCVLAFAQDGQRYDLPCEVTKLPPDDPRREETWWHNALFNPALPPDVPVLAFAPRWLEAVASPAPARGR